MPGKTINYSRETKVLSLQVIIQALVFSYRVELLAIVKTRGLGKTSFYAGFLSPGKKTVLTV